MLGDFYKENEGDAVWWVDKYDDDGYPVVGEHLFSFDKKKIFNLFKDYPHELTNEQKEIFDRENPYWADFFKGKRKNKINNQAPVK